METRALDGLRVLELGSMVAAPYCAKLMADLGADVVKVEAPGAGDPARQRGPFPGDTPHPEKSALFLYVNTSKRGITLDLTKDEGRALFRQLASKADLIIEDRPPGELAALDLDYQHLAAINPKLVMASITPFGQSGPYSGYRTYHLNQYHAGGFTSGFYEGKEERAPARGGGYVAEYDAGLTASVACMAALLGAEATGHGRQIDLSKQEASMCLERVDIGRATNDPGQASNWGAIGGLVATKDGHLVITASSDQHWRGLVDAMGSPDWASEEWCGDEKARSEHAERIQPFIKEWAADHTRDEIYRELQSRGTPAGPVLNVAETRNWVQLRERGFFVECEHPEAGVLAYAGTPGRFSTIQWAIRPAPLLGEHNREIYGNELSYGEDDLARMARSGVI